MEVTNLKSYLASVGMTMKDFAKKIDCQSQYLSVIANGNKHAGKRLAQAVFEATGGVVRLQTKKDKDRPKDE